jgi:hypothetical protein
MNWEAIGAVGEMLGATVVFASVVYLAIQVRTSSRVSQDEAFRGIGDTWIGVFKELADVENGNDILQGLQGYNALEPNEKFRFDSLMHMLFTTLEAGISSFQSGIYDEEAEECMKSYLSRYYCYPGMFEWWQESKTSFVPPVREWIDRQFPSLEAKSGYWEIR